MQSIDAQKQEARSDDQQQIGVDPQQPIQSQHLEQYLKFFNIPSTDVLCEIFENKKNAGGSSFFINEDEFVEEMLVRIVTHSYNFEFLEIEVKMGNFTFPSICVTAIDKSFQFLDRELGSNILGSGMFGKVYACEFLSQKFALKAIKIKSPTDSLDVSAKEDMQIKSTFQFEQKGRKEEINQLLPERSVKLKLVIREYCIALIASEFGVGPRITKYLGSDIIVYYNFAVFTMEICPQYYPTNNLQKFMHQLKENLLVLHSFRIIHRDIKTQYIKLSQDNKYQFIDYGFSKIIKETLGQKTDTFFLGSLRSCGSQMLAIWNTKARKVKEQKKMMKVSENVDLYYNDIVGLKYCFEQYVQYFGSEPLCQPSGEVSNIGKEYILPYIKFLLYKDRGIQAKSLLQANPTVKDKYFEEIKKFIQTIRISPSIQEIREIFQHKTIQNERAQNRASFEYGLLKKIAHEERNNSVYYQNFKYIEKSNEVKLNENEQIQNNMAIDISKLTLPEQLKNVQVNVFLQQFCKAIQINSNNYTAKQKNEFCRLAKPFLSDKGILLLTQEVENNSMDKIFYLTQLSTKLFNYSLSIPQSKTKINIFHRLIYNVALLECFSFNYLLQLYQKILYFNQKQLAFLQKMRHALKFQSIFIWYYFDVRLSFFERIKMWKSVIQVNRKYSEYLQKNDAKLNSMQNLIKDIILTSFPYKKCRKNIALVEEYSSRLKGLNFKDNQQFKNQLTIWIVSNQVYLDKSKLNFIQELQNAVFNNLYDSMNVFEYYHFFLIEYYLQFHQQAKLFALINHFNSIFTQNCIINHFQVNAIRFIIDIKSQYRQLKITELIKFINDILWVNPYSNFGFYLNEKFNHIISSIEFDKDSPQMQFIQQSPFLISYDFNFHEDVLDCQFLQIFSMLIREQFLKCGKNKIITENKLIDKIEYVRSKFEEQLSKFDSKDQPHNRILMLVITTYIEYRRFNFDKSSELIEEMMKIIPNIIQNQQIHVDLVKYILNLITKIASTSTTTQKNTSLSTRSLWMNYYSVMQKENNFFFLINRNGVFLRMFSYFSDSCQWNVLANMVNRISLYLKHYQSFYLTYKYFETLLINFYQNNSQLIVYGSKKIYPYLQKTKRNPYNALFLIFLTTFPGIPDKKTMFLQICRAFKRINFRANEYINEYFYLSFMSAFIGQLKARKDMFLLKRHMKHNQHIIQKDLIKHINQHFVENKSKPASLLRLKSTKYYLYGRKHKKAKLA